jgi:site-specific recombinase XerC
MPKILRRRAADGRVRRILRSAAGSAVPVSVITPAALESLVRQSGDNGALFEWLALELNSVQTHVEWLVQANKVAADEVLSIEWSALPAAGRVSLERLLASPGKRRLLSTPGRLRLLKRL